MAGESGAEAIAGAAADPVRTDDSADAGAAESDTSKMDDTGRAVPGSGESTLDLAIDDGVDDDANRGSDATGGGKSVDRSAYIAEGLLGTLIVNAEKVSGSGSGNAQYGGVGGNCSN